MEEKYCEFESKDGWIIKVDEERIKELAAGVPKDIQMTKGEGILMDKMKEWAEVKYSRFVFLGSLPNYIRKDNRLTRIFCNITDWSMYLR